jgi:hypothetical protein
VDTPPGKLVWMLELGLIARVFPTTGLNLESSQILDPAFFGQR